MALFDTLKEAFRQNPPELEKPHFYKTASETRHRLEFLREFWWTVSDEARPQLEQDIILLLERIEGEKCLETVLCDSDLPIVVLHDLHFEEQGISTRIDYLVITAKFILVVECKDLFGHIEVTGDGRFIRTFEIDGHESQEEIRSPISQNAEHLEVIKRMRLRSKSNGLFKEVFERTFEQNYLSIVVLASPGTTIDLKQADLAIKSQIIHCGQLPGHIQGLLDSIKRDPMPEKAMYELAYFFMSKHDPGA